MVRLQSGDPHVPPVVDPKYMAEKEDVDAMIEAVRQGGIEAVRWGELLGGLDPRTWIRG